MTRRSTFCLVALATMLVVSGCTGGAGGADDEPEPDRPVYAGTRTEYMAELAACLQTAGLDARSTHDQFGEPVVETAVDPESTGMPPEHKEAQEACTESLPVPPSASTPEEFRQQYDNELAIYECVVDAGYAPDPPSSFEVYLETVQTGQIQWMPYDGLEQDYTPAHLACPRDPDAWF